MDVKRGKNEHKTTNIIYNIERKKKQSEKHQTKNKTKLLSKWNKSMNLYDENLKKWAP